MVVLGIDPGTNRIGYGLIDKNSHSFSYKKCGVFEINDLLKGDRLQKLEHNLAALIKKHKPGLAVVESLFFLKNKKTAISVAEARGVVLLTLAKNKIPFVEVTPREAKLAVSGWGASDKKAIQKAVCLILKMKNIKALDDATDALAIAITGALKHKV